MPAGTLVTDPVPVPNVDTVSVACVARVVPDLALGVVTALLARAASIPTAKARARHARVERTRGQRLNGCSLQKPDARIELRRAAQSPCGRQTVSRSAAESVKGYVFSATLGWASVRE